MRNVLALRTTLVAVLFLALAATASAQNRRTLPPLTPEEAELALRYDVQRQLQRRVGVADSATLQRLITSSLRYSDSARALAERESIVRSELNREASPSPLRAINEARVTCLIGELTAVERRRFDLRVAHRTEVAAFQAPLARYQYMSTQESVSGIVGDRRKYPTDRREMLARAGVLPPVSPTPAQTRAQMGAAICP